MNGGMNWIWIQEKMFETSCHREGEICSKSSLSPCFRRLAILSGKLLKLRLSVLGLKSSSWDKLFALCQVPLVKFLLSYRFVLKVSGSSLPSLLTQAQALTFLVRDQRLGANVGSAQGPTGLGKYLMRSPTGEVIFGGETMRFSNKKGRKNRVSNS